MIQLKEIIGLPSLKYHIDNELSLHENVYRYSSDSFLSLFREARQQHRQGNIQLNEYDLDLIENTDIGEFGVFEGKKVPLDLPMIDPIFEKIEQDIQIYQEMYGKYNLSDVYTDIETSGNSTLVLYKFEDKHNLERVVLVDISKQVKIGWIDPTTDQISYEDVPTKYSDDKVYPTVIYIILNKILPKLNNIHIAPKNEYLFRLFRATIYYHLDDSKYDLRVDNKTNTINISTSKQLNEAEYQGKDVDLNKPKRGGSGGKKYYVYVKNPKTGKVKKVNFGASGGGQNLSVKLDDPKRRKAFADRHNCDQKKDKTKPGYWACRITRYWKSLGGSKNYPGYW